MTIGIANDSLFCLQVAMQAVTQPVAKSSQSSAYQPRPKAATITLKNFAAFSKS